MMFGKTTTRLATAVEPSLLSHEGKLAFLVGKSVQSIPTQVLNTIASRTGLAHNPALQVDAANTFLEIIRSGLYV